MGLFGKGSKTQPQQPIAEPVIEHQEEVKEVTANITDKMLRVELEDGEGYAKYPELKMDGERIRIVSHGIIIAEVGKRGKAYKELEPYVGKSAESVRIRLKNGDYGDYYNIRLRFVTNTATITF